MKKTCLIEAKKRATKKGKGVSNRTYDKKVSKFAEDFNKAFHDLQDFVSTNCRGNVKKRDKSLDAICEIVDRYIELNDRLRVVLQVWSQSLQILVRNHEQGFSKSVNLTSK